MDNTFTCRGVDLMFLRESNDWARSTPHESRLLWAGIDEPV